NDPAEPNPLTQSLQLTCSLMPRRTVPSTRLVMIWLKRWSTTPLIEPLLVPESLKHGPSELLQNCPAFAAVGSISTWRETPETSAARNILASNLREEEAIFSVHIAR